ncbi:MAG: hypothetical protein LBN30_04705 [Oscillospiraceae bacterium]|jgi:hypothetical protein|nr:hypothetical protein [Oscillospiraceae bacterium]
MIKVSVFERESEGLRLALARIASRPDVVFGSFDSPDVLIVSPESDDIPAAQCGSLLIPGNTAIRLPTTNNVVTYGFSPRDTLSLSSIGARTSMLELRREIVNALGEVVEIGEFAVAGGEPTRRLAVSGALLLLGISPETPTIGGDAAG